MLNQYKGLPKEIYILFICTVINNVGSFVLPLMSLILTQKIGFSAETAGAFATLAILTQGPCLLLGGKLIDSVGRKKIIVIFQSLGSAAYIACGFVKPGMAMALLILLASALYIIASPALNAITADTTNHENRKTAFSVTYMGANLGYAIGPVVGGILFKSHLPLMFIGDASTTILSMLMLAAFIKETRRSPAKENARSGENAAECEKGNKKLSTLQIIAGTPALLYFAIIMMVYTFAYSQWSFSLPLQMGDIYKADGAHIYSLMMCLNAVTVIFFTPLFTHITQKLHSLQTISIGGVFYFTAFLMFAISNNIFLFFAAVFIMTVGEIIISVNDNAFVADNTPNTHRGRINSLMFFIKGTSYALGPLVMGHVITSYKYSKSWMFISALMLVGFSCMFMLYKKISRNPGPGTESRIVKTETADSGCGKISD